MRGTVSEKLPPAAPLTPYPAMAGVSVNSIADLPTPADRLRLPPLPPVRTPPESSEAPPDTFSESPAPKDSSPPNASPASPMAMEPPSRQKGFQFERLLARSLVQLPLTSRATPSPR